MSPSIQLQPESHIFESGYVVDSLCGESTRDAGDFVAETLAMKAQALAENFPSIYGVALMNVVPADNRVWRGRDEGVFQRRESVIGDNVLLLKPRLVEQIADREHSGPKSVLPEHDSSKFMIVAVCARGNTLSERNVEGALLIVYIPAFCGEIDRGNGERFIRPSTTDEPGVMGTPHAIVVPITEDLFGLQYAKALLQSVHEDGIVFDFRTGKLEMHPAAS